MCLLLLLEDRLEKGRDVWDIMLKHATSLPVSLRNEVWFKDNYHQENVMFHKEQVEELLLEKLEVIGWLVHIRTVAL